MISRMPTERAVSCLERLAVPISVLFDSDICLLCWFNYFKFTMSISSTRNKHSPESCMRTSVLKKVLNGNFHHKQVTKMNSMALESLVLRLLEYPSVKAGTKTSLLFNNKERVITYSSDGLSVKCTKNAAASNKVLRDNLIQFVLNCCNYFRGYKEKWLPNSSSWRINDENFDAIGGPGVKRKRYMLLKNTIGDKKRKTLFSKNDRVLKVPLVDHNLQSSSKNHTTKPLLNQSEFLSLLNLGQNNNLTPAKSHVPNFSRLIKLNNCPQIPLSSDIGRTMMHRENCRVPDFVIARKLERTEWYINKEIPKCTECRFEVSYVPRKNSSDHVYKFPVRQYCQFYNDRYCTELQLTMCKPLLVELDNMNLVQIQKKWNELKVNRLNVIVPKLSIHQLKRHLCRNLQVVLDKNSVTANRFRRRPSLYQRRITIKQ